MKYRYAVIRTNKGDIKLRLFTDIAPMTCLNFIRLAQSSFYDKTLFHRVIPNFVIQGGDPLNTGWGGTEYTIRSEFSPVHFSEGKLGMASDGKDTEGSQFFIMHIPHLHLDGKYTVFGEVTDGMDVVNKIFTDDYVISVSVSEN
ncbi:MAG TPA: peptidylprolyl isomerase [Ignavibacteria bacterium]|nr:peptidylprolyl isomerase [Ignavibacteria bacterium]